MIETIVTVKLESFDVPTHVVERLMPPPAAPVSWGRPSIPARPIHLSEIPAEVLLEMCEEFKKEVFKRAGKSEYLVTEITPVTAEELLHQTLRG